MMGAFAVKKHWPSTLTTFLGPIARFVFMAKATVHARCSSPAPSGPLFVTHRKARLPRRADLDVDGYARLSYRQADTLWKRYTPDWDLHQLRHTPISLRAAHDYTEVDLKRFSGHSSLRSLERYIADNREAAKRKAREWERRERFQ